MVFLLSLLGAGISVVGFLSYNKKIISGIVKPNMATWILFSFLSVLNLTSYLVMTQDIVKSLLPLVSTMATLSVLTIAVVKGQFSKLNTWDTLALIIGGVSGLVWLVFKSAGLANLILQFSVIISFIPTYWGIIRGNNIEKISPWMTWTTTYIIMIFVVAIRNGQWIEYIYPVVAGVLHSGVGIVVCFSKIFCRVQLDRDKIFLFLPKRGNV